MALGGLAAFLIALAPSSFEGLVLRLRRLGPAEFDPTPVKGALAGVPENVRAKAEHEAQERIRRLEATMGSLPRLVNRIAAEIAALGVRVTAIGEELSALKSEVGALGVHVTAVEEKIKGLKE